ncbi:MAG: hypothetical protein IKJ15_04915 [Lachnospiraceae bacterium]|nr:hypothetical protein [Lachnospiraceae bacterium]
MLDSVLEAFMQLKTFILVSGIGIVLVGIFLLFFCSKFSWTGKNLKAIGFFYNLSVWDTVGLACCFIKFFLIFSIMITTGKADFIHMIIFGVLELFYIIHRRSFKGVLLDVVLCVVSVIVLNIMNMLHHYLNEILYDVKIVCVVWLLGILLCLYSIYDLMHCVKTVVETKEG